MNKLIFKFLIAVFIVSVGTAAYAEVKINESFDDGSMSFFDDTNGTFQAIDNSGNKFGKFALSTIGENEVLFSSLIFDGLEIEADTTFFSFDYKFEYEFNSPTDGIHAGKSINNVLMDGADYFRISFLGDFDYEIFKSSFDPSDIDGAQILESPASDVFGFAMPIIADPSVFLPGFTHIEIDMTDFIASQNLLGETLQVFVEIINGNEYFDFIDTNNLLTLDELNTTGSVDNIYFGPQFAAVPEPSAVALSMLGILYMFRKIRKKCN